MESALQHLSFYKFIRLGDSEELTRQRSSLKDLGRDLGLRGTILLAPEGINAMISGAPSAVSQLKEYVKTTYQIEDSAIKEASVPSHAFSRFLVKIKKEIISLGFPNLVFEKGTGRRVSALELRRWLDEGRAVSLIDTRNDYEVAAGTFKGAEHLSIDSFREFAQKAKPLAERCLHKADTPVVTFCTGGIRCEKATALLMEMGLKNVYQLDGGILRYFEVNGAAHYEGNCFVFDERLAVDGHLKPTHRSLDAGAKHGRHKKPAL